jgi:ABC-type glycerol-3-phosphate transport system substrate-binding protein
MKKSKVAVLAAAAVLALGACTGGGAGASKGDIEIWSSLPRQG